MLLAETDEGYKNLIKLVSAGYTEGFYYRPRIDKELLARHAKGLIGLSSCLKGEVASALRIEQARPALEAAARLRDILGPDNFFLEMQYQGIEEQRIVNKGLLPIASDLNLPIVATNDVHYLRQGDHQPHDILLCIGTGKTVNDAQRLRYTGDQFFLKTAAQMAEVFKDHLDGAEEHAGRRRALQRHDPDGGRTTCRPLACPRAITLDQYFEHVVREGFTPAADAPPPTRREGPPPPHRRRVRASSRGRDRDDQEDGVRRVLPHRLGLHPLRAPDHRPGLECHAHERRIPEMESQRREGAHRRLEIRQASLFCPIEQPPGDLRMLHDELAAAEKVAQRRCGGGRRKVTQRFLGGRPHRTCAPPQMDTDDSGGPGAADVRQGVQRFSGGLVVPVLQLLGQRIFMAGAGEAQHFDDRARRTGAVGAEPGDNYIY